MADDEAALTEDIIALARQFGRYGYRRITALLRDAGWLVNKKRVERIWRQEGLKVPQRQPKRGRLWLNDGSCIRLRPERPDHVWAYDFVEDRTHDGRKIRMLNIVDETVYPASPGAPFALRRANIFIQGGPNKPFLSMVAISPEKVIVFGAFRMTMATSDAGATWTDLSLNIDDRLSHNLYAAVGAGGDIYVAGEAGEVFRSSDGGKTFPAVTSPAAVTFFGVLAAQDGSILVFGVAGNLFRSADQGQTWKAINLNTQDDLTAGLAADAGRIYIATEAGALFVSKDNGASFSALQGGPPMAIFDIAEAPDGDLVFAGDAGAVRISLSALTA